MPKGELPTSPRPDSSSHVVRRLAKMRMLRGIPFQYLVPAEDVLPVESLRFFHIDQNWLDALIDGALNVCMRSKSDIEWLNMLEDDDSRYEHLLRNVNQAASRSRGFYRGLFNSIRSGEGLDSTSTSGGSLTGMLLRSTLVRDYPGLEISAYRCPDFNDVTVYVDTGSELVEAGSGESEETTGTQVTVPTNPWLRKNWVQTLRMEKLSSSVMLCIFNDVPTHVRIQEPSEGLRMGVDGRPDPGSNHDSTSFMIKIKNSNGRMNTTSNGVVREMVVRTRSSPTDDTVLDISGFFNGLQNWINSEQDGAGFDTHDSALIATQMLQLPYQQDFIPLLSNVNESTEAEP